MRKIEYLSPSGIGTYEKSTTEYYLRYLADNKPPRDPQTQPMAIGSAFDAYVKNYLHVRLFGKDNDPRFGLDALLESQVEPQWRDWGRQNGLYVFEQYKQSGALGDLFSDLSLAQSSPRFEFELKGAVHGFREGAELDIAGVTLLGKPDVHYINQDGCHVILDFKVNGFMSAASPAQGYIRMRSAGMTNHGAHKHCQPMRHNGMLINIACYLEQTDESWARQLAIYGWLMGTPVGSDFLVAIDQIVCNSKKAILPEIRVAEHRSRVSPNFQWKIFNRAAEIWDIVHSDHFFRDLSKSASRDKCTVLDKQSMGLSGLDTSKNNWFAAVTRDKIY